MTKDAEDIVPPIKGEVLSTRKSIKSKIHLLQQRFPRLSKRNINKIIAKSEKERDALIQHDKNYLNNQKLLYMMCKLGIEAKNNNLGLTEQIIVATIHQMKLITDKCIPSLSQIILGKAMILNKQKQERNNRFTQKGK